MKAFTFLLLLFLLLAGCTAPAVATTDSHETTVTTFPLETTHSPETTPLESTVSITPTEASIQAVVEAFLSAYEENCYLYTDNEYDHLTVLAADPATIVIWEGNSVPLSDFHGNIQTIHDKEAYWKQARQNQGSYRDNFKTTCHFNGITFDGDTATVMAEFAMSFSYTDQPGTTSGGRDGFELLLVQVDGSWLIANITEIGA